LKMASSMLPRITRETLFIKGSQRPLVDYSPEDEDFLEPDNAIIAITDIARAGVPSRSSFLQYAIESYSFSLSECQRKNSGSIPLNQFLEAHQTLRNSLISVCQMVLSIQDEYMAEYSRSHADLWKYLKADKLGRQLPAQFWELICRDWEDDESLLEFLSPIFGQIQQAILSGVRRENIIEICTVLTKLLLQVNNTNVYLDQSSFLPIVQSASQLELNSLLLGILSYRADNGKDPHNNKLFFGFSDLHPNMQNKRIQEFRGIVHVVQDAGLAIFQKFFKSKKLRAKRERVLSLLSTVSKQNSDRKKMRFNPAVVSSDGMLSNLSYIMLKLCLPILTGKNKDGSSRMNMIQTEFFYLTPEQGQSYVSYENVSRISASTAKVAELSSALGNGKFELNFMTKMLALGLEILHIGLIKSLATMRQLEQSRHYAERRGAHQQAQILRTRAFACIAHYYDPKIISEALVFYDLIGEWILNLAQTNPEACSVLPEYVFEDVIAVYNAIADVPPLKKECSKVYDEKKLLSFCIKLLAEGSPCKNIHHRGKLIRVLIAMVPRDYETRGTHHYISHSLNQVPEAPDIVPRLLKLYADVEDGDYQIRHSYRYELAIILKFLWLFEAHQKAIQRMWKTSPDNFIRMINMLINDNISLLDSALDNLKKLVSLEQAPDAMSEENQKKREEAEKDAKQMNQLSLANLDLLCWLTQNIQEPFFDERILGRIAVMIDFYLKKLTLDKKNFKSQAQQRIAFEPKKLMRCIVTIFRQLANFRKEFLKAISKDDAYYSPKTYQKALSIFQRIGIDQNTINDFTIFAREIEEFRSQAEDLESRLGDIPDKYLDPMLCTLMRDPVRLPTNQMVMDRTEISKQLLNKSQCPFTKKPLKAEELIPVPDLKQEIEEWIQQRLAENDAKMEEEEVQGNAV